MRAIYCLIDSSICWKAESMSPSISGGSCPSNSSFVAILSVPDHLSCRRVSFWRILQSFQNNHVIHLLYDGGRKGQLH